MIFPIMIGFGCVLLSCGLLGVLKKNNFNSTLLSFMTIFLGLIFLSVVIETQIFKESKDGEIFSVVLLVMSVVWLVAGNVVLYRWRKTAKTAQTNSSAELMH